MDTGARQYELYNLEQLIKESFSLIRNNIKVLMTIVSIPIVINLLLSSLNIGLKNKASVPPFLSLAQIAVSLFTQIALIYALNNLSEGQQVDAGRSFETAFQKFLPYVWVVILMMLVIIGGFILLIVPGIIIAVLLSFSGTAFMLEDKRGPSALSRSKQLVRGNWWYVLGISLGCALLYALAIYLPFAILVGILRLVSEERNESFSVLMAIPSEIMQIPSVAVSLILFKNMRRVKDREMAAPAI